MLGQVEEPDRHTRFAGVVTVVGVVRSSGADPMRELIEVLGQEVGAEVGMIVVGADESVGEGVDG
jgi:hypothetical protein